MKRKNNFLQFKFLFVALFLFSARATMAACSSPTANAGAREWFSAEKKLKYCNGTAWVSMQYGGLNSVAVVSGTAQNNFSSATNAVVSGTYAYIVGAQKFSIVDLSGSTPTITKTLTDSNFGSYVAVYGNYAYVSGPNRITPIDISSKSNPIAGTALIDATNLPSISALKAKDGYLYAGATSRLTVVDISTPATPVWAGTALDATKLNGSVKDIDFTGNYVVVSASTYDGISIIDVSTKTSPTITGFYTSTANCDNIQSVKVYGNYVYTAGSAVNKLGIIDITNKASPSFVLAMTSSANFGGIRSLAIKNEKLFVGSAPGSSSYFNMVTLDLTLPTSPVVAMTNDQGYGYNPFSLNIDNNTMVALSSVGNGLLMVFDVGVKPLYQTQKSIYMRGSPSSLEDVAVVGNLAVGISSDEIMYVYDVTSGSAMVARGVAYMPGEVNRYSKAVAFDGTYAYVTEINSNYIYVVDVSNPDYPQVVGIGYSSPNYNGIYAAEVSGNYLYVVGSWGLSIVDVTTKTNPTFVSNLNLSGVTRSLKVNGNYVYVPDQAFNKVHVVDVTTKASPTLVGSVTDATNLVMPTGIDISGSYAYVATSMGRLTTLNITSATAPTVASSMNNITNLASAFRVKVSGSNAYVLGTKLSTLSLTSPASPTYSGNVSTSAGGSGGLGVNVSTIFTGSSSAFRSYSMVSSPVSLNINYGPNQMGTNGGISGSGNYAWVTSNNSFYSVNISSPTTPSIVSTLTDATKLSSVLRNSISGTRVFAVGSGYLTAVDVSTPTSPTISGYLSDATNLTSAKTVKIIGSYAYVGGNKLSVLNVSGANPVHVASVTHAKLSGCQDMEANGNYLYLTCGTTNSFIVVDISTPTSPSIVGIFTDTSILSSLSNSSVYANGVVYIGTGSNYAPIIDVSNPANPTYVGTMGEYCSLLARTTNANTIYCKYQGVMYTVDVTNPLEPTDVYWAYADNSGKEIFTLGSLALSFVPGGLQIGSVSGAVAIGGVKRFGGDKPLSRAIGVDIVGNYAYVSTTYNYLNIYNIADVTSATLISSTFIGDQSYFYENQYDIAVSGNYAYIAGSNSYGSRVFDISNPVSPKSVGSFSTFPQMQNVKHIKISGSYLYGTGGGFAITNITSPTAPVLSGALTDATYLSGTNGFDISGNYAYVCASGNNRITAVNITTKTSPTVSSSLLDATRFAGCMGVAVSGTYAVMLGQTNGYLSVVDITNPASMSLVGSLQNTSSFGGTTYYDIGISGTTVVVANASYLTTVDISTPTSPTIIDTLPLSGAPAFTDVVGDKVFVAHNTGDYLGVYSLGVPINMGACSKAGLMDYDVASNRYKFCNGTTYYGMNLSGAGGAGCSSPTGVAGALDYFSATNVYKYCDGTNWVTVGQ